MLRYVPLAPTLKLSGLVWLLATPILSQAQSLSELREVESTLEQSEQTLSSNKNKRQKTLLKIETIEKQISERALRSDQTQIKVDSLNAQADVIKEDRNKLKQQFSHQQQRLSKLVESAYLMGNQSGLKIALSEQGTQHASRLNHYARNIAAARQDQLTIFEKLEQQLKQKNNALAAQQSQLAKLSIALKEDHQYLNQLKQNRLAMIKTLDQAIDDGTQTVKQLRQRKARLETLLAKIAKRQAAIEKRKQEQALKQSPQARLASTKNKVVIKPISSSGTLPLPVKANIVARFGDRRAKSGLPWSGILLQGQKGSDIRAISAGEVVYSDWLQGYGKMVIVDHGKGVMSLYGHNKIIHKAVGDHVRQSDIIASMGDTAGLKQAALYFEIRQHGIAQDPLKWCQI